MAKSTTPAAAVTPEPEGVDTPSTPVLTEVPPVTDDQPQGEGGEPEVNLEPVAPTEGELRDQLLAARRALIVNEAAIATKRLDVMTARDHERQLKVVAREAQDAARKAWDAVKAVRDQYDAMREMRGSLRQSIKDIDAKINEAVLARQGGEPVPAPADDDAPQADQPQG
jgi:hypothetical protein